MNWLLEAVLISAAQLAGLVVVVWLGYCALLFVAHSIVCFFRGLASTSNRIISSFNRGVDLLARDISPTKKEWIEVTFFNGGPKVFRSRKDRE